MKLRSVVTLIVATLLILSAVRVRAAGPAAGGVDYEANLAKVPAQDPAATDAPQVVEAMKG
ncbi:MAG: hypothetical protein JXL80_01815, partial [Planctomycetes bacterium]|nr:hypothetical protein [Planctomycetota bacterium]